MSRWQCREGDHILWVLVEPSQDRSRPRALDSWVCGDHDEVVLADRREDCPDWLVAQPDLDAPTVWRTEPGD